MILGRSKQNPAKETPKTPEPAQPAPQPTVAAGAQPPSGAPRASVRPRDARQLQFTQNFAQVVAVLMRDPNFRKLPLAELEWLVLPPLMSGQFRLAHLQMQETQEGKPQPGMLVPVAVALWARVSAAIDAELTEKLDQPVRLPADKWSSGDKVWLMAAAGDPRTIPTFLEQLAKTDFKDQEVKMRRRGPDGKVVIARLGA
jgi:cytolysin-activating lysine-acyltransferase